MALTLVLGNKNYSSWSLRPYLALAHHKVPFEEVVIPLYEGDYKQRILKYSPAGKVPILVDDGIAVWESLAILDYLAEKFPKLGLWPADSAARAHARAISAEMHAGFAALRNACSMNLKRVPRPIALSPEVEADVARVTEIWNDTRQRFGKGGKFLFGELSAADCMYAPVATRFRNYAVPIDLVSSAYVDAIHALPAFIDWREAGLKEPWTMKHYDQI